MWAKSPKLVCENMNVMFIWHIPSTLFCHFRENPVNFPESFSGLSPKKDDFSLDSSKLWGLYLQALLGSEALFQPRFGDLSTNLLVG